MLDHARPSCPWALLLAPAILFAAQAHPQNVPPASPQPTAASNLPPAVAPSPAEASVPVANPGRPTVSNPATLPPVGYLQFEQGVLQANNSPDGLSHQFSINQTVKLAVLSRLMLTFAWQPFASTRLTPPDSPATTSTDLGDLQSGIQAVILNGSERSPALALSYAYRLREGTAPDLDIGGFSQSAILYLSGNLAHFHYDANVVLNEQDQPQEQTQEESQAQSQEQSQIPPLSSTLRRAQLGQTLSVAHELFAHRMHDNLGLSVELWHFTQPLVSTTIHGTPNLRSNAAGVLIAPSYNLRPNLVIDAGFDRGLTSTSTAWQGFAGFTYLLPHRLWPQRTPAGH